MSVFSIVCLSIACICNSVSILFLSREKRRSKSELKVSDLDFANRLQSLSQKMSSSDFSEYVRHYYSSEPTFVVGDSLNPDND